MKNLMYKELKLVIHPAVLLAPLLSVLLLAPAYPYFAVFTYPMAAIFIIFKISRENKDIFFTASLPVCRKDIVKARVCTVIAIELLQIVVSIPFMFISKGINPNGNTAGMDADMAFLGFVFIMYVIFNSIFLPMFYKTAYSIGMPFGLSITAVMIYLIGIEIAVQLIPFLKTNLDTTDTIYLIKQLPLLIAGIVIYALTTVPVYKRAAKNFEKIDL